VTPNSSTPIFDTQDHEMGIALPLSALSLHDHRLGLTLAPLASHTFVSFNVEPSCSYFVNSQYSRVNRVLTPSPGDVCPPVNHPGPTLKFYHASTLVPQHFVTFAIENNSFQPSNPQMREMRWGSISNGPPS
jgi:hypothetical protein